MRRLSSFASSCEASSGTMTATGSGATARRVAAGGACLNFPPDPAERRSFLVTLPIVAATLFALLTAGCGREGSGAGAAPPPIEVHGTVRPAQTATISAPIDGVVTSVAASEGGTVAAGALVVQLANASVERDAAVAQAQLDLIDARLRRSGRPARGTARGTPTAASASAASGSALAISTRILDLRKERYEKMKALRGTNDVTAGDLQQAEVEYLAALRDYDNERRVTQSAPIVPASVAADDSELLRLERQRLLAEQKFAMYRQSLLAVRAPFAGVITRVHARQGASVYPRDPIAEVADLSTLQVRGGIDPELLRYVRPGTHVDLKILSTPVRTIAAQVETIVPAPPGSPQTTLPEMVITLPNADGSLQPNTDAIITVRPTP
jgi:HlyD family secretion protein